MINVNYHRLIKRLIFIFFVLILVNIAYADTSFAANINGTNNTNITDSNQVSNLTQTDTKLIQANKTNLNQTSPNSTINPNPTIKSANVANVQSTTTVQNIQGIFINPVDTPVTSINPINT